MAEIHFFWPGLWYSLLLSILLSVLLTIGLNLWARRQTNTEASDCFIEKEYENADPVDFETPQTKTSGMILIGPIPILFGSEGIRFDKKIFIYALLFFLILLFVYFILMKTIRL